MKKIVLASVAGLFSAAAFAGVASADGHGSKMYVGLSGMATTVGDVDGDNGKTGTSLVQTTSDIGTSFGAAVRGGYDFGALRAELELSYRDIDIDKVRTANGDITNSSGSVNAYTAMINGLYDIDIDSAVTPYVMAGVGVLKADGDVSYTDDNGRAKKVSAEGMAPAAQIGVGVSYGVTDNIDVVGGYSYMGAMTDASGDEQTLKIHTAQVGFNYKF